MEVREEGVLGGMEWALRSVLLRSQPTVWDPETQRPLVTLERAIMLESRVKGDSKQMKESRERGRKESQL